MAEEGDPHQVELGAALGIESPAGKEALAHLWAPAAQTVFPPGDHEVSFASYFSYSLFIYTNKHN